MAAAINVVGQLYPNLFAVDIADLHTYKKHGKLHKTNCYSTYFDLISGKRNTPAIFQNFGLKLAKSVTDINGLRDVFQKLSGIKSNADDFFINLMGQIERAEWETGTVRAEFRLRLCDFTSMVQLLTEIFCIENIKQWTSVFSTSNISRLAKYYIYSLKQLLMENLLQILANFERRTINNIEIMKRVTSISLLESLITTTLFSGLTYSFVSELVWNRSNNERNSLELMKFIRSHNRLIFQAEFFQNSLFRIAAPEDILGLIFQKINRNSVFNFAPVQMIINFNDSRAYEEKADLLWKIYFSELNNNAFLDNVNPRWKIISLNRQVITDLGERLLPLRGATGAVFNFENFRKFKAWKNRYYLQLADKWVKEIGGPSVEILNDLLVMSMKRMEIEHIHYAGNENFNGNSARHVKVDCFAENTGVRLLSQSYIFTERDTRLLARSLNGLPTQWLDFDIMVLVDGVNRHQSYGTKMFDFINSDESLKFKVRRDVKKLGKKWKDMVKAKVVRQEGNNWYVPGLAINIRGNSRNRHNTFNRISPPQPPPPPTPNTLTPAPAIEHQLNVQASRVPSSSFSSSPSSSSSISNQDMLEDYAAMNNEYDNFPSGKYCKLLRNTFYTLFRHFKFRLQ